MPTSRTIHLFAAATLLMASLAVGSPVVTMSTTPDIGGSGFQALDFFYSSSPGADFTNYRLNLETTGGGFIYDPVQNELQNTGANSIDTYMNTVGSYLGISNATHIQNTYKPIGLGADSSSISRIDWSVFDTLSGDSNAIDGFNPGPYHLARVLVSPDAQWNASFAAYDTSVAGVASTYRFTNDNLVGEIVPVETQSPLNDPAYNPYTLPPPPAPRPVVLDTPPARPAPPTIDPITPPPVVNPTDPIAESELPTTQPSETPTHISYPWMLFHVIEVTGMVGEGYVPINGIEHSGLIDVDVSYLIRNFSIGIDQDPEVYPIDWDTTSQLQTYLAYDLAPSDSSATSQLLTVGTSYAAANIGQGSTFFITGAAVSDSIPTPEPGTAVLVLIAIAAFFGCRR